MQGFLFFLLLLVALFALDAGRHILTLFLEVKFDFAWVLYEFRLHIFGYLGKQSCVELVVVLDIQQNYRLDQVQNSRVVDI